MDLTININENNPLMYTYTAPIKNPLKLSLT